MFKPWDNWDMDCVCVPFRVWMGKTKYWSAFERGMVVGAERTGLSVPRTATLLGFSRSTVSHVYQEWSTTQRTSSQLDTTQRNIGVNTCHHPCGMILTPCRVHGPTKWGCSEGKRGCNSILGWCSLCFIHSAYTSLCLDNTARRHSDLNPNAIYLL